MARYSGILIAALVAYWFILSGYFDKTLLLILGALSVGFVLFLVRRMNILDSETVPYGGTLGTLIYLVWLFKEIVKANVEVVRAVMSPDLEVNPSMIKVRSSPKTEMGKTLFANSITLTPGTVSVEMNEDEIIVHALLSEMSDPAGFEEMGDRSARAIGEPAAQETNS